MTTFIVICALISVIGCAVAWAFIIDAIRLTLKTERTLDEVRRDRLRFEQNRLRYERENR